MFETIVVGTDGSETAQLAVSKAIDLAQNFGSNLHIVSAYSPKSLRRLDPQHAALPVEFQWAVPETADANIALAKSRLEAEERGVMVETHAVAAEPADAIVGMAEEVDADLIIIGSRGIERRLLGSVPNSVTHRADRNVLIIHTA
jgi:nucleotide-binding universal stress UspA family protein